MVSSSVRSISSCCSCATSLVYVWFPSCSICDKALDLKPAIFSGITVHVDVNHPVMVSHAVRRQRYSMSKPNQRGDRMICNQEYTCHDCCNLLVEILVARATLLVACPCHNRTLSLSTIVCALTRLPSIPVQFGVTHTPVIVFGIMGRCAKAVVCNGYGTGACGCIFSASWKI